MLEQPSTTWWLATIAPSRLATMREPMVPELM
jgi:hypothetical protein